MPPKMSLDEIIELLNSVDRSMFRPDERTIFNGAVRTIKIIAKWNRIEEDEAARKAKEEEAKEAFRQAFKEEFGKRNTEQQGKPSAEERAEECRRAAETADRRGDFGEAKRQRARETYYRNHEARKAYQRNYSRGDNTQQKTSNQKTGHGSESRGSQYDDHTDFFEYFCNASSKKELHRLFMDLVRRYHPDQGGDHSTMARINAAHDQVKKRFNASKV